MSVKKIKELIDLMNDNGLLELELEQEGLKVRLSKASQGIMGLPEVQSQVPKPQEGQEDAYTPQQDKQASGLKEVTSPMVGTFYMSPSPEAETYVKVGDVFSKGDVLCIVEAMKLMNEVKAEFGGKVVEILVENAESVEFGQPLFLIEPA